MKIRLALLLLLFSSFSVPRPGAKVIYKMYHRYHGKWQRTLKFTQHTEKYRNDSLVSTETWYETIVYPNLFRIDFGNPADGNCLVFRYDSVYRFKMHELVSAKQNRSELVYLIGGMYFENEPAAAAKRIAAMGYDLGKTHKTVWNGRKAMVIGSLNDTAHENQLYVALDNYNVLRTVKYDNGRKQEVIFDKHIKAGGGWSETLVTFYTNGHLTQKEIYRDVIANDDIDTALFHPATLWQSHWYKTGE
ncbi:MAG: hypothetical protein K0Q79_2264 [Flavipsychrobacter sp.]|jgi:hypothetical protein|nr:hypothetical protein [Flavipsychrobacter sp.]